ncbi:MAG: SDR family oxidoreductase [Novosphingobium sp.]|nr:SDR family oxidoreductase [Novosphingobium sp.]
MGTAGRHAGKRYVIVGGTAGMGFAAAQVLAGAGGRVALIGQDAGRARDKAALLGADHVGDGAADGGVAAAVERCARAMGGLDGIAVTAGPINSHGGVLELTDADWQESFETIFLLTMRAVRAAIPLLAASGGGTVVTTAAYSTRAAKQRLPHYAAMKSAVVSLTKNIAKFHAADHIRANCIAPGAVASEALDSARAQAAELYPDMEPMAALNRFMVEDWGMKVAMNRVGLPSEIGELIAFLLSDAAGFMTGALINIDGGTDF